MADTPHGQSQQDQHSSAPPSDVSAATLPPQGTTVEREQHAADSERDTAKALKKLSLLELLGLIFNGLLAGTAIAGLIFLYRQTAANEKQTALLTRQYNDAKAGEAKARNDADLAMNTATSQAGYIKSLAEQTASQAAQTTLLAEAAGKSAAAAEKSEAATEKLARATSDAAAASHSLAESAGQSTAATQRLAAAANDANAVSRELVKTTHQVGEINQNAQRAFVFVKGLSFRKVNYAEWYRTLVESKGLPASLAPVPNDPNVQQIVGWKVNLIWENSGSTPTKSLTISNNLFVSNLYDEAKHPFDVSAIQPDDKMRVKLPDEKVFIGPKQSAEVPVTFFEPLHMILGALFLPRYYIFGTATYKDILNPSYVHRVDYCFLIHLTGDARSGLRGGDSKGFEPLGADLVPCANHNCMDEECDQKQPEPITSPEPSKAPEKPPT